MPHTAVASTCMCAWTLGGPEAGLVALTRARWLRRSCSLLKRASLEDGEADVGQLGLELFQARVDVAAAQPSFVLATGATQRAAPVQRSGERKSARRCGLEAVSFRSWTRRVETGVLNALGITNVYKGFWPPSFVQLARVGPSWGHSGANHPIKWSSASGRGALLPGQQVSVDVLRDRRGTRARGAVRPPCSTVVLDAQPTADVTVTCRGGGVPIFFVKGHEVVSRGERTPSGGPRARVAGSPAGTACASGAWPG